MKIIRYQTEDDRTAYGELLSNGTVLEFEGSPLTNGRQTGRVAEPKKRLAPVEPRQIIGIGLNYATHAAEAGMDVPNFPVMFLKALGSVQNPEDPIILTRQMGSEQVDYEAELAVVIGRTCRDVNRREALDYVLGFTCANDVSARDWQLEKGGSQWSRGKSFDTFCPLGPVLVTTDEFGDPNCKKIRTMLNGEIVQDGATSDMVFDVPALIEFLSAGTTLMSGTVILTGTPPGVGSSYQPQKWLQEGDEITVEIEGIGALRNRVAKD